VHGFPEQKKRDMDHTLQVRLLLRVGKLPLALLKTTAVIPFPLLVDGVNGLSVLEGLEASRTFLVLEIVGKPHTKSLRSFSMKSCLPCPKS
jgi:hypothetical protein